MSQNHISLTNKTTPDPRLRRCYLIFAVLLLMGVSTMSQAQTSIEDLQERTAIAEAEKKAIDAEIALEEAKKKLFDSQAPVDPNKKAKDATLDAAKSAKEIADAQKAQADAELAAFKAKIGEVPSSGISGSVKLEQGAGSFETALLATRSTVIASKKIAEAVVLVASAASTAKLFVFAYGEVPDFQATTGFFAQRAIVLQSLTDAVSQSDVTIKAEAVPIAAAGIALDAVTKLLGFFKSDFEIHGSDVAADHLLLARAVAGELLKKYEGSRPEIYLKGAYNPTAVTTVGTTFKNQLASLTFQRDKASTALIERERDISGLQTELSKISGDTPADIDAKRKIGERQKLLQGAVDKLKSALAAYDTFVSRLASPDANITAMIRELDVWSALNEPSSLLLAVKMDKAGGSNYVEKNLLTSFGKMPFKVMGGVIASYTLFQGNSGVVLGSGVIPIHGGFKDADEVGELF